MRWLVALFAVCGCNQLLGLDSATDQSGDFEDRDGDGVTDSHDNCVDIPNADQTDSDGDRSGDACDVCPMAAPTRDADMDGVDDACDLCLLGPNIDDDGDGVFDGCDLCPATPKSEQLDDDGDLVGNSCDVTIGGINEHLPFVGFVAIDPAWPGASDWSVALDGSSVTPTIATTAKLAIGDSDLPLQTASVMFDLPVDGEVGVELALDAVCRVACAGPTCTASAEFDGDTATMEFPRFETVTVQAEVSGPGQIAEGYIRCQLLVADRVVTVKLDTVDLPRFDALAVLASPGEKVLGADLVQ